MTVSSVPALEVSNLTKRYGATLALDSASFVCDQGETHGLIGENGAGKSTLVKILSGVVKPDHGLICIGGQPIKLHSPVDAFKAGIVTAFQELSLVPHLTVAQNLLLGREPRSRSGLVSGRIVTRAGQEILNRWDVNSIAPETVVSSLPFAAQQQVEIVKALSHDPKVLLLDEPTSALGPEDVDWLYTQVERIQKRGSTVVFISHRMGEVRGLCHRVTILRNGQSVGTYVTSTLSDNEVVRKMLGRAPEAEYASTMQTKRDDGIPALEVTDLQSLPELHRATFALMSGEILGVAALEGQGQKALFMSLFGAATVDGGTTRVHGKEVHIRSPRGAVRSGIGISLVPEERKLEGLLLDMSVQANTSITCLPRYSLSPLGWVNARREREAVRFIMDRLNVDPSKLTADVSSLSGGNQQKIVIGKWLLAGSRILLLYDPTRGVDVGTKAEIFALMRQFAADGGSILFYSSDIEELVNLCSRVLIYYGGRIQTELHGTQVTREAVLSGMLGMQKGHE